MVFLLPMAPEGTGSLQECVKSREGHEALVELALPSQPPHPPGVLVTAPAERLASAGPVGR